MDLLQVTIFIMVNRHLYNRIVLYAILGTTAPNKWIIHLEGGGWCYDEDACVLRSKTNLGSSKNWPDTYTDSGLLSDDCTINPYYCGWSMVFVGYCDGASFAGYV